MGKSDVVREPARDVPVADEVDVCVIGGSCTGVFAAVAAARAGCRAAVVEALGFFGGTATASLVCVWHGLLDANFAQPIIGGLTAELLERLGRRDAVAYTERNLHRGSTFNPAEMIIELDELVGEAKVRPFLHARFAAVHAGDDGRPVAAIIEDKTGRRAIRARVFIDATGDGDLLARAALPVRQGPGSELQPPTACAVVRGVRAACGEANPYGWLNRAAFDPADPDALPPGFLWNAAMVGAADETMVAGTRVWGANCADADELTAAEIEGRRQVRRILDLARKRAVDPAALSLAALPARIGVRETRHAECLHRLSDSELLTGVRFDDAIANGTYPADVHHSDRPGLTFRYLDGREVYAVPRQEPVEGRWLAEGAPAAAFYQIPYRSLVVRGSANVLAAGRLIDADRGAYGAIRVMVNCNQTGQAAGVAAALAVRNDVPVADVDPATLRRALSDQGAIVI